MQRVQAALMGLLIGYSLTIIFIEWRTDQDYVRNYVADISGPVRFYAVNTTLSAFLLWSTALVFALNTQFLGRGTADAKMRLFYISQFCVFCYLGVDERFMLHEWLGGQLGVNDAWLLLTLGLAEIGLLAFLGELKLRALAIRAPLLMGAVFFSIMVVIDGVFPEKMRLRLSFEDLAKTWGSFSLFLFSVQIFYSHVSAFKRLQVTAPITDGL
jgi:hypothetical protein